MHKATAASLREEAASLLGLVGAQIWFVETSKPGRILAEVALPLRDGHATVKVWSACALYDVHVDDLRAIGPARHETSDGYAKACAHMRELASEGRFS